MGAGESTDASQVAVSDVEQQQDVSAISVTYGPNIVGQLLGYDERTETLSLAAEQLYDAISRPSKNNTKKVVFYFNFESFSVFVPFPSPHVLSFFRVIFDRLKS